MVDYKQRKTSSKKCLPFIVLLTFFVVVFVTCGIVLPPVIKNVVKRKIDQFVAIKNGSEQYKSWHDPQIPIYQQFFMFNLTNLEEIKNGGKPNLRQIGPFSYRLVRKKNVLRWNKNDTVKYYSNENYYFDQHTSCDECKNLDQRITTVNIPIVGMLLSIDRYPNIFWWKNGLDAYMESKGIGILHTKTVRELIWGYEDPFLEEMAKFIPKSLNLPKFDPFVALQKNNTKADDKDYVFTIYTGVNDVNKVSTFDMWNGEKRLAVWKTPYANMINGSDGSQFWPDVKTTDVLHTFTPQSCRSLFYKYHTTLEFLGVKAHRFMIPREVYESGDVNKDNLGFCRGKCLDTGLLDGSACQSEGHWSSYSFYDEISDQLSD